MNRLLFAIALCLPFSPAWAEGDDFGIWSEVNVEKKLSDSWELDGGIEFRSRDKVKEVDRWSAGVGISYKITDWLKASAGYTLLDDHRHKEHSGTATYADFYGLRHRFSVSLTGSYDLTSRLDISLRERWQYTYRPSTTQTRYFISDDSEYDERTYKGKGKNVWRNRLQLRYKITKRWRPYINAETNVSNGLEKIRYAVGTEIRLKKHHWLDAKYMFQRVYGQDDDDEPNRHILSIGYTYKF